MKRNANTAAALVVPAAPTTLPESTRRLIDYDALSSWLGVPLPTIRSWVCRGTIPHFKLSGRVVRFDVQVIEAWVAAKAAGGTP